MTSDERIHVKVASYGEGRNLMMTYVDPIRGRKVGKSAGTRDAREAERRAAVWQDELNTGRYQAPSRLTWQEFRERLTEEKLGAMPKATQEAYNSALNHFERIVGVDRLCKVTPQIMSRFQADARKEGVKATTLHKWLRHLKATLRWAERQGLLQRCPVIDMPKLGGGHLGKHRAPSGEEIDRMEAALEKLRPADAPQWKRLLVGLHLSGLRLSEALRLDWNAGAFVLDTTGGRPVFRIQSAGQKSRRAELVPATPDFVAEIVASIPVDQRCGRVFPIVGTDGKPLSQQAVSKVICSAGAAAGVVVGEAEKVTQEKGRLVRTPVKVYAGPHDLRRAFCTKWARRVMPAVLQRLARHSSITTTMGYYVCMTVDDIAGQLWGQWAPDGNTPPAGNSYGNTDPREEGTDGKRPRSNRLP